MRWLLDVSTKAKLCAGFGLMIVLLGIVVAVAYHGVTRVTAAQRYLYEREFEDERQVRALRINLILGRSATTSMTLVEERARLDTLLALIKKTDRDNESLMRELLKRNEGVPERRARLREIEALSEASRATRDTQVIPDIYAGKRKEASRLLNGVQSERAARMDALGEESIREMEGSTQAALLRSERESREVVNFLVGAAIVASGLGLAIAIWLTGAITGPLNSLSAAANRIATGDLTVDLPVVGRRDETGALVQSLATMVGSLREIMKQVREGIGVLGTSAGEITAATSQVAAGSAESATAVSQTTATVEEVKQTAHISAQKAKHVSDASQRSAQTSLDGKSAMNESIDAMHRIQKQMGLVAESIVKLSEQSEAIGEILSTVNEFAEQSNLLAVNAAIEAAKAGDQGRGFAVVAQEIKSLSEQSKQATAQVRTILGDIQKATSGAVLATEQGSNAVDTGVKLYGEVGNSIRTMAESIVESSQAASQIASSAQQQLIGMDQVAMAMQNINQASAQNLQSTRRAEAAARDLQDLGRTLTQLVAQFRI